jgi:CRP/FNR family transcriptional regulator
MTDEQICADCEVRQKSLCGALKDRELAALNRIGRRRHLRRGETLAWSGDVNGSCANLLSGVLKLTASTPDGREQAVGIQYPADFVGQPFAETQEFTVTAVSDAELCVFPRLSFGRVLEEHPSLERELLLRTLGMLEDSRRQMLMLGRHSAMEKVAGFLLDCGARADSQASRAREQGPFTFDLPMSRGEMAELLGLTIETVSRQLTKLRAAGIIAIPGIRAVTIRNEDALAKFAGAA